MRISANLGAKLRSRPTVDVDVDSFAVLFFFIGSLRVAGGSSSFSVAYAAGLDVALGHAPVESVDAAS